MSSVVSATHAADGTDLLVRHWPTRRRGRRGVGRPSVGARCCWSTASANTPGATSTSATSSPARASSRRPTTSAGTAGPAAGAGTSSAGRSTTTTSAERLAGRAAAAGRVRSCSTATRWAASSPSATCSTDRPKPDLAVLSAPGARLDPAGLEEGHRAGPGSARARPRSSERDRWRRRCRATPVVAEKAGADPLSVKVSTARFGAEAIREQARVRRDCAGLSGADPRDPRRGRRPRPGDGVSGPR